MFVFFFTPFCVSAHVGAFRDPRFSNNSQRSGQRGLPSLHKPRQKNGSSVCSGDWVKGGLSHHIENLPELMLSGGLASSLKSKSERERKSLPLRSPWETCMSLKRLFPWPAGSQMLCRVVLMSQGCLAPEKPRLVSWTWAKNMSVWPGLCLAPHWKSPCCILICNWLRNCSFQSSSHLSLCSGLFPLLLFLALYLINLCSTCQNNMTDLREMADILREGWLRLLLMIIFSKLPRPLQASFRVVGAVESNDHSDFRRQV